MASKRDRYDKSEGGGEEEEGMGGGGNRKIETWGEVGIGNGILRVKSERMIEERGKREMGSGCEW